VVVTDEPLMVTVAFAIGSALESVTCR
jgi:hypothetical protein